MLSCNTCSKHASCWDLTNGSFWLRFLLQFVMQKCALQGWQSWSAYIACVLCHDWWFADPLSSNHRLHVQVVTPPHNLQNWSSLDILPLSYAHLLVNMSTAATEIADFIQQFVHQQQCCQGAICPSTTVLSRSMYDDWGERIPQCGRRSKTSLHHRACHRLGWQDSPDEYHKRTLLYCFGSTASACAWCTRKSERAQVLSSAMKTQTDAVILHSKLAAAVIDTLLSMQKAMSATRLRSCWSAHITSTLVSLSK